MLPIIPLATSKCCMRARAETVGTQTSMRRSLYLNVKYDLPGNFTICCVVNTRADLRDSFVLFGCMTPFGCCCWVIKTMREQRGNCMQVGY